MEDGQYGGNLDSLCEQDIESAGLKNCRVSDLGDMNGMYCEDHCSQGRLLDIYLQSVETVGISGAQSNLCGYLGGSTSNFHLVQFSLVFMLKE